MATRIIVCGMNGAGKSTFGRALADRINYRFVDVEDLYFPKTDDRYIYTAPRSRDDVGKLLMDIIEEGDNLVFASVTGKYIEDFGAYFKCCVMLEVPKHIRMERIKRRSYEKFGERMMPGGDLYEKEQSFYNMVGARSENLADEWARAQNIPIIRLDGEKPVEDNIEYLINNFLGGDILKNTSDEDKNDKSGKTFGEMIEMYRNVVKRFNKIELNEWNAQGAMIELMKQVGELSKWVMIKEKYYALTSEEPDVDIHLGNEMADVIAQVIRLADVYNIDLEKAYIEAREDEARYLESRGV